MVLLKTIDMICLSIIIKTRGTLIHSVKGYEPTALRGETAVLCLQLQLFYVYKYDLHKGTDEF